MQQRRISCETANKLDLLNVLKNLGFHPAKESEKEAWYLNPFKPEKTPSFKISKQKNVWYCFSDGVGGTVIDFVMKLKSFTILEALDFLSNDLLFFSFQQQQIIVESKKSYEIQKITNLENPALLKYILERKISISIAQKYCQEIHYSVGQKYYLAIAFKNRLGGYEVRNKNFKGCLGKKDITTIFNQSKTVSIFESWSDFLSYLTLKKEMPEENFIILNSTAMVKKASEILKNYSKIKTFLDNDNAGDKAYNFLKENYNNEILDNRIHYKNYNDLNEFLIAKKLP